MAGPKITMMKTDALIPYARNPRTHSDMQVGQIAASIKEFGWLVPAVVDSENVLIACEKLSRICRMMELAPNYVDVIVRRWQDFTGKEATLDGEEITFRQAAEAVAAS